MPRSRIVPSLALAFSGAGTAAFAHHGIANFDLNKDIEINGTVAKLAFVNPHSWLYIDATNANGEKSEWRCEMRSASSLRRSGWTQELFKAGTGVVVTTAVIGGSLVLMAASGMRHPPVFRIVDHALWYYQLPLQAVLLFSSALALSRLPADTSSISGLVYYVDLLHWLTAGNPPVEVFARAKGGAGLLITGNRLVHPTSTTGNQRFMWAYLKDAVKTNRRLTDAVHEHGAAIFEQLNHFGGNATSDGGLPSIGVSAWCAGLSGRGSEPSRPSVYGMRGR